MHYALHLITHSKKWKLDSALELNFCKWIVICQSQSWPMVLRDKKSKSQIEIDFFFISIIIGNKHSQSSNYICRFNNFVQVFPRQ